MTPDDIENTVEWLNQIVTNPLEWHMFYSQSEQALLAACALDLIEENHSTAYWVKMTGMMPPEYAGHYECSQCGWHGSHNCYRKETELRFCPQCGSVMVNSDNAYKYIQKRGESK